MKVILITAIGGDIAQGVAKVISEMGGDYRLVGVDMHDEHGGRMFVDAFFNVPPATDAMYVQAIRGIVEKESVDIIVPMAEPELAQLEDLQNEIKSVDWIIAGMGVISTGLDKLTTAKTLAKLGLQVPWTTLVQDGPPKELPCILKSRTGSGSRTVFTLSDDEDVAYFSKRYPDAIYQELLEPADKEVTCAVYRTKDNQVAVLQMLRKLVGGFTGWAKIIDDSAISNTCKTIAEGLNLRGSMNVQLRLTDNGPRVFEINPRFSSTTLMRHQLGFSDVQWAVNEVVGNPVIIPKIQADQIIVRVQSAAVIN
ncbi:MAG: ATP-grasp domain-containing protein [Gammaproteobacteria bacterium]|jgi:carbamoyl-phosphate synthase large subunit|nr:ATP-grasp domain-containing protein [Gammaproteobacteria bacterium]